MRVTVGDECFDGVEGVHGFICELRGSSL